MGRHRDLNPGSRESESRKLTTPTHRPEFFWFFNPLYYVDCKKKFFWWPGGAAAWHSMASIMAVLKF